MTKQFGFTLIEILVVLAVLFITLAGGVVVWEKRLLLGPTAPPTQFPTTQPTLTPGYQNPTPTPSPRREFTFPTEYSCNSDSDCVLKDRPYCCGERLEYYKWCYPRNIEPEVISCKGVGSCPGIVGSAKSCACQNGKCTVIF